MTDGPTNRLSVRAYRALLHAYPRSFRERNGREMVRDFALRAEEARRRRGGMARLWLLTVRDFARNAPAERLGGSGRNPHGPGPSGGPGTRHGKRGGGGMDSLIKDIRYGVRTLLRSPAFTSVAVLTIGLGIGANTAIFSVVRAVLLAPLPYENPDELVMVWGEMQNRGVKDFATSPSVLQDMREQSTLFQGLAGAGSFETPLAGDGDPIQIEVGNVTPDFFSLLGVRPVLGRDFRPEDAAPSDSSAGSFFDPGANPPTVTILSHGLWQQSFGGDPSVVGRTVDLGGDFVEVIGVLPADFTPLLPAASAVSSHVDAWITPRIDYVNWNPLNAVFVVVGRLRPGATARQAQAEMDAVAARVRDEVPTYATAGFGIEVVPMQEDITEGVRPIVLALLAAVGFVLLIACANVSNLLLVRAASREQEVAIRAAMGGSRRRLVRQMLIESLVLAGAGGLLGLGLAHLGVTGLLELRPENLPRMDEVAIDGLVLAFTVAASIVAAVVFGLVPALQGTRPELVAALKERSRTASSASGRLLRNAVVVSEVALSVVLLVGAGLMLRSFVALQNVDPGYEPDGVLTFTVPLPGGRYPDPGVRHRFQVQLQERLAGLPGVRSVGAVYPLPLTGPAINGRYGTEEALADEAYFRQGAYKWVLPGYFESVGARLLAGRTFTPADNADSAAVVVVDEKLAEQTWPGESAVGKRMLVRVTTPDPQWVEVVGVVRHQRHAGLAEDSRELVFLTERYVGSLGNMSWTVRTDGDPFAAVAAVRREVADMDPAIPLADVRTFRSYVDASMAPTRFALVLIGLFGVTALVLASIGLYGVLSSVVKQRVPEIGVRMAFGARSSTIERMVVAQGMKLAGLGLVVGLGAAFALTGGMEALLVGVNPGDPLTFGGIAVIFSLVAALACYVPARRATRVDPVMALREG